MRFSSISAQTSDRFLCVSRYHSAMMTLQHTPCTNDEDRWRQFNDKNRDYDGAFVIAVRTTGIYCRPSCPARRPKRKNVTFYDLPEAAELAGFRACKRCRPASAEPLDPDRQMVRAVCRVISESEEGIPTLDELSDASGVSPHHLQRRFKSVMGVSPRAYADEVRRKRVRTLLKDGTGVADALYGAGYGSSSRLYENAESWLGMTPASYAKGGKGAHMQYAITDTPLGRMIVAATDRGISFLGFGDDDQALEAELHGDFPDARIEADDGTLKDTLSMIMEGFDHQVPRQDLPLDVRATAFQAQVWQALRDIPPGETRTYADIAESIGKPKAARAVGRACATNPVSLVVPCHRAVGSNGALTGYRWGVERKRKLLSREQDTS